MIYHVKVDYVSIKFGPFSADMFASSWSARMFPYWGRELGPEGNKDAFTADWRVGFGFFHPPVGMIPRVIRMAKECEAKGCLLVPDWPNSPFAGCVWREGVKLRYRFKPYFESQEWVTNKSFKGRSTFDCLLFEFKF